MSGTPAPISATQLRVSQVIIQADTGNVGDVYVGDIGVTGAECIKLSKNCGLVINADDNFADEDQCYIDLSTLFVDGTTSGDKVNIFYLYEGAVEYTR